jgi:hypothetical protein
MVDSFIFFTTKNVPYTVLHVMTPPAVCRPAATQESQPHEELAACQSRSLVKLFCCWQPTLAKKEGLICRGRRILLVTGPFPNKLVRGVSVKLDLLDTYPSCYVLLQHCHGERPIDVLDPAATHQGLDH